MKCGVCRKHKSSVIVCVDGKQRCRGCLQDIKNRGAYEPDKHAFDWHATTDKQREKWR